VNNGLLENARLLVGGIVAAIACVGCGGPYDATVTGVATLDGQPLPRGIVSFAPQTGGPLAYGRIQSDGRFSLWTGMEEGLASGAYAVTVMATEESPDRSQDGGPPPMGKLITPMWYQDPATSGLTFTIESGDNVIDLKLNSTPPSGWTPPPGSR
jgi:hypothetical protein